MVSADSVLRELAQVEAQLGDQWSCSAADAELSEVGAYAMTLLAEGEAEEAPAEGDSDEGQEEDPVDDVGAHSGLAQCSAQSSSDGRLHVGDASSSAPGAPVQSDAGLAARVHVSADMEELLASLRVAMLPSSRFVAADSALPSAERTLAVSITLARRA